MKSFFFFLFAQLPLFQYTPALAHASKYIMHSSGLYIGQGRNHVAVLASAGSDHTEIVPFVLDTQADGTHFIALPQADKPLYLGLGDVDGWTTFFLHEKKGGYAQYAIEQTGGKYVKLRNIKTGKYLGTDASHEGATLYSDKSGTDENHLWLLADKVVLPSSADTLSYMINALALRQPIEGWGVSLCWWARMCGEWSDEKINMLVDWMVSPTGLNWNIFRYNIGGGDDPDNANCDLHHMGKGKGLRAEMEGFQDHLNGPYHWERDKGQRKLMLKIRERRPDAVFEAFSNSAPWWMTHSGCCAGNTDPNKDNLKPECYKAFAEYLVNVCRHYKEKYGIEFKTLEPFNEPVTDYWYANGGQEGCHFSTEEQVKFVRILHPILKASGLKTVLACSDETDTRQSVKDFMHYRQQGVMHLVGQWNTHTYGATNRSRSQVGSLARSEGKTIWMDEVGAGGKGLPGNLDLCQKLFDDMHYILPSAWLDWQFVEEHNDQWCLARANFSEENSIGRVPNYYVRQQVTRFIGQGCTMVTSTSRKSLAALNPRADTLIAVLLNNGNRPALHRIQMPGIIPNGMPQMFLTHENRYMQAVQPPSAIAGSPLAVTLPPYSIATLVLPIEPLAAPAAVPVLKGTFMIVPQSNCEMALTVSEGGISLAPADASDKRQLWTLTHANGSYRFTNGVGQTIANTGAYALSVTEKKNGGQWFRIEPVEDYFYKIMNTEGKAFDLQGDMLLECTPVGLYPYGPTVSADTRNWHLVPMHTQAGFPTHQ